MPRSASARRSAPTGRALETRARLIEAGRRAFASKGLAGVNLKADVLDPAGVSVGSFYHQFEDKTELLVAILAEHSEQFRTRVRAVHRPRPGRTLEQLVRDSYELLFADVDANDDILQIQLRERHSGSRRVRESLRADRERWIESLSEDFAVLREAAGLPAVRSGAAELIVALAQGAIARLLETPRTDRPSTRARLVENLVRFSLGGMAALVVPPDAESAASRTPPRHPARAD
jgi:AcrR family transcriptional regulator